MTPSPRILGIGTAVPRHGASQSTAVAFLSRVLRASLDGEADRALDLLHRISEGTGIGRRHSVLRDFALDDPSGFEFFPRRWDLDPFPSTADRMRVYERASVDLAEEASRRALDAAGVDPPEVTDLVVCTCTGFFSPGPDILLMGRLGLRPIVRRAVVGFMGCHAGFNGLRLADRIVRADPAAVVLHVSVELCTLHYQKRPDPDFLVSNLLFSDGCAAAVYGADPRRDRGICGIETTRTAVGEGSLDQMGWRIGDTGFEMRLSPAVPGTLQREVPGFVAALLEQSGRSVEDLAGFAIHPGGRRIVEAVGRSLGIPDDGLDPSLSVLRDFGNMSSGTIFFVLERMLRDGSLPGPVAALGFGPGLTLEGAILEP